MVFPNLRNLRNLRITLLLLWRHSRELRACRRSPLRVLSDSNENIFQLSFAIFQFSFGGATRLFFARSVHSEREP
jgi:hypothetical protein